MRQAPRLTPAKAQRALDAVIALIETRKLTPEEVRVLDAACNEIRKIRNAAEILAA
jgi:hypothetical protein